VRQSLLHNSPRTPRPLRNLARDRRFYDAFMINSFCRLAHRGGHHRGCALRFPSRISSRLYSLQVSALSSSKSRRSWRSTSDVVVNSRGRIDAPILTRSSNQSSQRVFFDWLEKNLGVVRPDDWYNIRTRQVIAAGGEFSQPQPYGAKRDCFSDSGLLLFRGSPPGPYFQGFHFDYGTTNET
jgi:hypothetical protein